MSTEKALAHDMTEAEFRREMLTIEREKLADQKRQTAATEQTRDLLAAGRRNEDNQTARVAEEMKREEERAALVHASHVPGLFGKATKKQATSIGYCNMSFVFEAMRCGPHDRLPPVPPKRGKPEPEPENLDGRFKVINIPLPRIDFSHGEALYQEKVLEPYISQEIESAERVNDQAAILNIRRRCHMDAGFSSGGGPRGIPHFRMMEMLRPLLRSVVGQMLDVLIRDGEIVLVEPPAGAIILWSNIETPILSPSAFTPPSKS